MRKYFFDLDTFWPTMKMFQWANSFSKCLQINQKIDLFSSLTAGDTGLKQWSQDKRGFSQPLHVETTEISKMEIAMKIRLTTWVMEHQRGKRMISSSKRRFESIEMIFLSFLHVHSYRAPGVFYTELQSNRNYTVDDSYYMYLASSLNYRSDLVRIVGRLQQLFTALTQKRNK